MVFDTKSISEIFFSVFWNSISFVDVTVFKDFDEYFLLLWYLSHELQVKIAGLISIDGREQKVHFALDLEVNSNQYWVLLFVSKNASKKDDDVDIQCMYYTCMKFTSRSMANK